MSEEQPEVPEGPTEEIFKCSEPNCKSFFTSEEKLTRHVKAIHSGTQLCKTCNKILPTLGALYQHRVRGCPGKIATATETAPNSIPKHVLGHRTRCTVMECISISAKEIKNVRSQYRTQLYLPTSTSRITKKVGRLVRFPEQHAYDYDFFVSIINPAKRNPTAVVECIDFADLHGEGPTYTPPAQSVFNQDINIDIDIQASNANYRKEENPSGLIKGHFANHAHHSRILSDFVKTFVFPNCAPMSTKVNISVFKLIDAKISKTVRNYGGAIVITLSLFDEREPPKWLGKENAARVGIPDYFGKILVYRHNGLHMYAWKSYQEEDGFTLENGLCNPFTLAQDAGFPLNVTESVFRSINGIENPDFEDDASILPPTTSSNQVANMQIIQGNREKIDELEAKLAKAQSQLGLLDRLRVFQHKTIVSLQSDLEYAKLKSDVFERNKRVLSLLTLQELTEEIKRRRHT